MDPYQRGDGTWMVPSTTSRPDGEGIIGDGYRELTPDHPRYRQWMQWLEAEQGWAGKVSSQLPGGGDNGQDQ